MKRLLPRLSFFVAAPALLLAASSARAQTASATATASAPTGAPPPDAKALVATPTDTKDAPKLESPVDGTTATLSAGGQLATGNSRLMAMTANGSYETRWSNNGIGASLLGNYGQGAPPGNHVVVTTENIQGRLRYDRYIIEDASVFLINTLRHDRFQGIDVRYNLDPGFKYLLVNQLPTKLWGELGYDFQYDVRRDDARVQLDATGAPIAGAPLLDKTAVDHSLRGYVGFKHAFNGEVTLSTGLEYLQSFLDAQRFRLNYDALFAAKVGGGLAVGLGFTARYDNQPLPGKEELDTATTVSLIYSFSDVPEAPKPPTCPCPPPEPPPDSVNPAAPPPGAPPTSASPPPAAPAPSAAPSPAAAPPAPQPESGSPPPSSPAPAPADAPPSGT